jgi:hypothetical protein
MTSLELLLTRIRGEYQEMPGLRLTFAQACRLWQMDPETCHAVLQQLVDDRVLYRTSEGAYLALSGIRGTPAKAALPTGAGVPWRARA